MVIKFRTGFHTAHIRPLRPLSWSQDKLTLILFVRTTAFDVAQQTNRWVSPSPCQQMLEPALCPPLLNLQGQKSSLYLHWGHSSCWGCPHWNSTERAPGHLVNWDILSTATCKEKSWKHPDFKPNYHSLVTSGNHCVVTFHIYDRKYPSRSNKQILLIARNFFYYKVQCSNTWASQVKWLYQWLHSGCRLWGCGRCSAQADPLPAAGCVWLHRIHLLSCQPARHKAQHSQGNREGKHRLKVFTDREANPTMGRFHCNAQNMHHSEYSGSFLAPNLSVTNISALLTVSSPFPNLTQEGGFS